MGKKLMVDGMYVVNKEKSESQLIIDVHLDDLKKMINDAEKTKQYFKKNRLIGNFLKHLSPNLTFNIFFRKKK